MNWFMVLICLRVSVQGIVGGDDKSSLLQLVSGNVEGNADKKIIKHAVCKVLNAANRGASRSFFSGMRSNPQMAKSVGKKMVEGGMLKKSLSSFRDGMKRFAKNNAETMYDSVKEVADEEWKKWKKGEKFSSTSYMFKNLAGTFIVNKGASGIKGRLDKRLKQMLKKGIFNVLPDLKDAKKALKKEFHNEIDETANDIKDYLRKQFKEQQQVILPDYARELNNINAMPGVILPDYARELNNIDAIPGVILPDYARELNNIEGVRLPNNLNDLEDLARQARFEQLDEQVMLQSMVDKGMEVTAALKVLKELSKDNEKSDLLTVLPSSGVYNPLNSETDEAVQIDIYQTVIVAPPLFHEILGYYEKIADFTGLPKTFEDVDAKCEQDDFKEKDENCKIMFKMLLCKENQCEGVWTDLEKLLLESEATNEKEEDQDKEMQDDWDTLMKHECVWWRSGYGLLCDGVKPEMLDQDFLNKAEDIYYQRNLNYCIHVDYDTKECGHVMKRRSDSYLARNKLLEWAMKEWISKEIGKPNIEKYQKLFETIEV